MDMAFMQLPETWMKQSSNHFKHERLASGRSLVTVPDVDIDVEERTEDIVEGKVLCQEPRCHQASSPGIGILTNARRHFREHFWCHRCELFKQSCIAWAGSMIREQDTEVTQECALVWLLYLQAVRNQWL